MGLFSAIGGLFGGGKAAQPQREGYQTLHDLFGDFTRRELPDEVMALHRSPRVRPLFRSLRPDEMSDPIFAPRALMDMQAQLESNAAPQKSAPQEEAGNSQADMVNTLQLLMSMQNGALQGTKQRSVADRFMADPEKTSQLATLLSGKKARAGGGLFSGAIVDENNMPIKGIQEILYGRKS